jgi:hypothetical protein
MLEHLKQNLDALAKTTTSVATISLSLLAVFSFGDEIVTLVGVRIPTGIAAFGIFVFFTGANLQALRLVHALHRCLSGEPPDRDVLAASCRLHPWLLNPFVETEGTIGAHVRSPRLAHPEQAVDFRMDVTEA